MERTYEGQLDRIASRIPRDPCIIALVPADGADYGAALANDLAGLIGRARPSHTLLLSLESDRSALDHEIGVEEGAGLTDVLAGRASVPQVASRGRARGFIYVPAGARPAPAEALLRTDAFRSFCSTVLERNGTILLYLPRAALAALAVPIAGLVWLGREPEGPNASGAAARLDAGPVLGVLLPPGERPEDAPSIGAADEPRPEDGRSTGEAAESRPGDEPRVQALAPRRRRRRRSSRGGRGIRRSRREARQRLLATLVISAFIAILFLILFAVLILPA